GPDAREAKYGSALIERKPDNILLLGLRICLRRIFGEAVCRHQAAVLRLEPHAPMRGRGIADVGNRRPTGARRRWHAPAHEYHFLDLASVAYDRRGIVWKNTWHRREVADVAVQVAKEPRDCGLVGGDRIKIAHETKT